MKSMRWILTLICSLGLSTTAQLWLDAQPRVFPKTEESLYLTSGEALKHASLGFDGLAADLYWIRAIQYFGGKLEQQRATMETIDLREMPLLEPLLEMTVELDPHHIAAYRFGAFFLYGIDPQKAASFAQQGIRNNPGDWRLYQDLGFIYWRMGRYREASDEYLNGSGIVGAPVWMKAMAAKMLENGGDRETAKEMFRRLCEGSDDRFIKQICGKQ
jgi:hypothetical protein